MPVLIIFLAIWLVGIASMVLDVPAEANWAGAALFGWGVLLALARKGLAVATRMPRPFEKWDLFNDRETRALYLGMGLINAAGGLLLMSKPVWLGLLQAIAHALHRTA